MNGDLASALALTRDLVAGVTPDILTRAELLICPPFVHLARVRANLGPEPHAIMLGAQDCSDKPNGAFTGDVSAAMLADCGCAAVILGHSERRQYHGETDVLINAKAAAAHGAGLLAIICVGETEAQRQAGEHEKTVGQQLENSIPAGATSANTVIAYEPVWAIGTGKTATPDDIASMHAFVRGRVGDMRILYGGSMKPDNAAAILSTANVDGGLIGGASLKAADFLAIARS